MKFRQIKETCLYISDIAKTTAFYHDILGLEIISIKEGRHAFFRAGTSVLLCFIPEVTKEEKVLPPHFAYGKQHIAFEVEPEKYEKWKEKLVQQNIRITHEQAWRNHQHSFYFEDPDGHVLEIVPFGIWE